jgi:hypothetical protein
MATPQACGSGDRAHLLHDRVEVCYAPVLSDLAINHTHRIDGLKTDFGARTRDAKEIPPMRAMIGLEGGYYVTIDALPMIAGRH